jgi:sec-independent protein translocase protein TatC
MSSGLLDTETEEGREAEGPGAQMSFLDHLDELRRRLVRSAAFVFVALLACWFVSGHIYNFLSVPVLRALADAAQRPVPLQGLTGGEAIMPLTELKEGEVGRYVFGEATKLGPSVIPAGASVAARVTHDHEGRRGVFTAEPILAGASVIPAGVRLPVNFEAAPGEADGIGEKLVVRTATEPFMLYVQVSLYAALCISVPFLLWQVWAFVSPGLYPHERGYALPFIFLSTLSFLLGAAFAYYVLFPPAVSYLLGLGQDFRLFLNATDYFDFIILIMLAMGLIFQMPAVTYVLARIGLISAGFLIRHWRISLIIILAGAAVLSPTADVLNMMLFAAPMFVLYLISILIAWLFARPRTPQPE